jgi:hypothetical protein
MWQPRIPPTPHRQPDGLHNAGGSHTLPNKAVGKIFFDLVVHYI